MSEETRTEERLSPSIVVLKSGEKIITFLQEAFEGEGEERKGICLVMSYPYELTLVNAETLDETSDLQVKYAKWCPFSQEVSYRIPYDVVMTLGTPDEGLAAAYVAKVEKQKEIEDAQQQSQGGDALAQQQADIAAAVGGAGVPDNVGVGADTTATVAPSPVEVV